MTTCSTFGLQIVELTGDGRRGAAVLYALGSVAAGLGLVLGRVL